MKRIFKLLITLILVGTVSLPANIFADSTQLTNRLISEAKYSIKAPYSMEPKGICMHNTWNTASARNEANYMENNNKKVSFHIAVDESEALLLIPLNRNAWHAGDSYGNRNFIGIEICRSRDYNTDNFKRAEERAVKVVAELCIQYGWDSDVDTFVKAHRDFSGKNCPHRTNMNEFKEKVKSEINRLKSSNSEPTINSPTVSKRTVKKIKKSDNKTINKINKEVDDGWTLVNKKYKYKKDGKFIKDQIINIDGKICKFDKNGFCILGSPVRSQNKKRVNQLEKLQNR